MEFFQFIGELVPSPFLDFFFWWSMVKKFTFLCSFLIYSPYLLLSPPTAYIKMMDVWLLFNLLKPFVDIMVQTYIETLRKNLQRMFILYDIFSLKSISRFNWCLFLPSPGFDHSNFRWITGRPKLPLKPFLSLRPWEGCFMGKK